MGEQSRLPLVHQIEEVIVVTCVTHPCHPFHRSAVWAGFMRQNKSPTCDKGTLSLVEAISRVNRQSERASSPLAIRIPEFQGEHNITIDSSTARYSASKSDYLVFRAFAF